MDVENGLSGVFSRIHNYPESGFPYPLLRCEFRCDGENMSHKPLVLVIDIIYSGDVLFWDYEDMYRCFGVYVIERQHLIVLIDDIAGNLFTCNSAENTFVTVHRPILSREKLCSQQAGNILHTLIVHKSFLSAYLFRFCVVASEEVVDPG